MRGAAQFLRTAPVFGHPALVRLRAAVDFLRVADRAQFGFEQLSAAMQANPSLWVILTLREDYVAGLEGYTYLEGEAAR